MAKITKLAITELKGIIGEQEFTGKDIIIGPNGAGKTARLKGLVVGIMGHDPEKGKRPMDTMRLASGNEMVVSIETDNGFSLDRIFFSNGKGKINHDLKIDPSIGEKGVGQCETRIKKELGDFPVMWDLKEFLDLSNDKKRDFIFNMASSDLAGWDKYKVQDCIVKKRGMIAGEAYPETLLTWVQKSMDLWKDGQPAQEALSNMIAYLKDQLSHWTKKEKEGQAAQTRVTELKAEYEDETAEPIADTKKAIETIQEELTVIREQLARDEERIKQVNLRDLNIKELLDEIKTLKGDIPPQSSMSIEELEKELVATRELYARESKIRTAKTEDNIKKTAELQTKTDLIVKLADHSINRNCPVSPKAIQCDQNFDGILEETQKQNAALEDEVATLKTELFDHHNSLVGLEETGKKLAADIETSKTNAVNRERIARSEKELQDLQKLNSDTEGIADPETLKLQQQGLTTRLTTKKEELDGKEKAKHALGVAIELAQEKEVAQANVEAIKELTKLLGPKGVQGDMVNDITKPLTDIMQGLVKSINPEYDFIFDMGTDEKPTFDLVCQIKGSWVLFDSLSAGESVIFSTALATALIIQRNPACKILGIEAGDCDREKAKLLLEGLDKFSDKLDNIIVCSHNKFEAPEGWKLWEL